MRLVIIFIVCSLLLSGCRFSVSADRLGLRIAIDQTAYLDAEDPMLYEDSVNGRSNPVDPKPNSVD